MKKIFTLVAMASMAWCVNAQTTEVWTVNDDATLKPVYVANENASAMSVVNFGTDNLTGTHTSGPIAGYTDADVTPLEPKVDNSWGNLQTKALSNDGSVAPIYYLQGKGNPVNIDKVTWEYVEGSGLYRAFWDNAYYQPDGSTGLPTNGTYMTFTPKTAGSLKVTIWINKGSRDVYVVKKSDAKALALGTEVIASGYINGQNNDETAPAGVQGYPAFQENIAPKGVEGTEAYVVGAGNQAFWGYLTFNVEPNETYYVFNKNTQIGFGGYEFTFEGGETNGIANIAADQLDENAPIYNVMGQRVNKDYKGILIQNGKKFINK